MTSQRKITLVDMTSRKKRSMAIRLVIEIIAIKFPYFWYYLHFY